MLAFHLLIQAVLLIGLRFDDWFSRHSAASRTWYMSYVWPEVWGEAFLIFVALLSLAGLCALVVTLGFYRERKRNLGRIACQAICYQSAIPSLILMGVLPLMIWLTYYYEYGGGVNYQSRWKGGFWSSTGLRLWDFRQMIQLAAAFTAVLLQLYLLLRTVAGARWANR